MYFLNQGHYPVPIAYLPSRKAWKKFLKKYKLPDIDYPQGVLGHCMLIANEETNYRYIMMSLGEMDNRAPSEILGTMAHECMHAVDFVMAAVGEGEPGAEQKAYFIQSLILGFIEAFEEAHFKLFIEKEDNGS